MKALIVANWKMNPGSLKDAKRLLEGTKRGLEKARGITLVVAPPSVFLRDLSVPQRKGRLTFGAQNAHHESSGAYTGEMSMDMVRDAKASAVLIGHAERRAMGETNDDVRKKVSAALSAGLLPIVCVGEKTREPNGEHFLFIKEQLHKGCADVPANKLSKIVIGYEPLWAIGATAAIQPRQMQEMSIFIRKTMVERFGDAGLQVKILYGGSIDQTNAGAMITEGDVKGFIIGRASTDSAVFSELLRAVADA